MRISKRNDVQIGELIPVGFEYLTKVFFVAVELTQEIERAIKEKFFE